MPFKTIGIGLLSLSLTACSALSTVRTEYQSLERKVPVELVQDCPIPARKGNTNGDLVQHNQALRTALVSCNDDKAAIRAWNEDGGR